jgi:hypothetical protein
MDRKQIIKCLLETCSKDDTRPGLTFPYSHGEYVTSSNGKALFYLLEEHEKSFCTVNQNKLASVKWNHDFPNVKHLIDIDLKDYKELCINIPDYGLRIKHQKRPVYTYIMPDTSLIFRDFTCNNEIEPLVAIDFNMVNCLAGHAFRCFIRDKDAAIVITNCEGMVLKDFNWFLLVMPLRY